MSPRKHHVLETTLGLVYAVLGRVDRVLGVGVPSEGFGVYDLIGELAAHNEGILRVRDMSQMNLIYDRKAYPDDVPLTSAGQD